ncbi:MAG TPA: hypothetical protein VMW88_03905, partial [Thermoplasmata archaeon]|nr:hypothetical protein [Thermoplasmata archaeon]
MPAGPDATTHSSTYDEVCAHCGTSIPGQGSYCPNCGSPKPSLMEAVEHGYTYAAPPPGPLIFDHYRQRRRGVRSWRDIARSIS